MLRVNCFTLSLDGYGAGPRQDLEHPLGVGGEELHKWFFPPGGKRHDVDEDFVNRGMDNLGAWIMGRNMFGPIRDEWPNEQWQGWWGENPPYHCPVFVLTHHARASFEMNGGTTFHFVTDGIHAALDRAREAAGSRDIRLGGGTSTIRQYLNEGLIDELHLAIAPVLLGTGEHLLAGIDMGALGYRVTEHTPSPSATHLVLGRR
ncbi:MAG: dihydrofolate reductase [Cytophagaceae bacterium]|nr:dihydrofolate reductase [Gemmatimonadaceae bacterium]